VAHFAAPQPPQAANQFSAFKMSATNAPFPPGRILVARASESLYGNPLGIDKVKKWPKKIIKKLKKISGPKKKEMKGNWDSNVVCARARRTNQGWGRLNLGCEICPLQLR
jgi:hypothetical protein